MNDAGMHVGEHALRRLRVGELPDADAQAARAHTLGCGHCRARLRALDEEQQAFQARISFDRFEAGVRRAARPRRDVPAPGATRWLYPAMAVAALALLVVGAGPLTAALTDPTGTVGPNRLKGSGAYVELRISQGEDGPQRAASVDGEEPLSSGERVRIGYRPGDRRYVLALSVDETGEVSPLYPEAGESLGVELPSDPDGTAWLPESLEFYGDGAERVVVVLTDEPLSLEDAAAAAARAFDVAGGDVTRLPSLDLPGDQFHRTLLKP